MSDLPPTEVLERGGIDPASVRRLEWRFPIWTCDVDGERLVLASKRGRTDESLDWEAALLDGLERGGFPACRAARIFAGTDYAFVDDVHFSARTWVPGRMLVEFDAPDLSGVGRFIGEYHDVASTLDLPQRPGIVPLVETLPAPTDEALLAVLDDPDLVRRYRELVDDVLPHLSFDHAIPVHGDFTTRNIAADGLASITGLIDFGMAHSASPAVELAYALGSARPTFDHVEHRLDHVTDLIRGYRSVRSLEDADAHRIVDFARSRPLLGIAIYAINGWVRAGPSRSLERVVWITENADAIVATIEDASSTAV